MNKRLLTYLIPVVTLGMIALNLGWPEQVKGFEVAFFIILMVLTGIPHGATDHLIYRISQQRRGLKVSYARFFFIYLAAMAFYGICWYVAPVLSLGFFLLLSAFHFGQSQLIHLNIPENRPVKWLTYITWGFAVLAAIVLLHPQESGEILSVLFSSDSPLVLFTYGMEITALLMGTIVVMLVVAWRMDWMSGQSCIQEIVNLGLLLLLCMTTSLLISFAVYFGLWHALHSIRLEVQSLRKEYPNFSLGEFVKKALPFSLISFVGVGILLFLGGMLSSQISPYLLFFIAISALTLPHMMYMQRFYEVK
ncbi:MAG: Brp/Blh family beta-carotene 15,15'-dioxygenase [Bacteroidota bacterium]